MLPSRAEPPRHTRAHSVHRSHGLSGGRLPLRKGAQPGFGLHRLSGSSLPLRPLCSTRQGGRLPFPASLLLLPGYLVLTESGEEHPTDGQVERSIQQMGSSTCMGVSTIAPYFGRCLDQDACHLLQVLSCSSRVHSTLSVTSPPFLSFCSRARRVAWGSQIPCVTHMEVPLFYFMV